MNNRKQIKEALMISVKPNFTKMILDGKKTIELRKIRPNINVGHPILLYSSSPAKELVAVLISGNVLSGSPTEVWQKVSTDCGVSKEYFFEYFKDRELAFAIEIKEVFKVKIPISLENLRGVSENFQPPQSYRYKNSDILPLIEFK